MARLSKLITKIVEGRSTAPAAAKELRAIADWLAGEAPPKQAPKPQTATADEKRIFERWQRAMGKPQAKFTQERRVKVRARLTEGYSVTDILAAIDNVAGSAWHRGENDRGAEYTDLTLICRNGGKLEQYRDMGGGGRTVAPTGAQLSPDEQLDELRERAAIELQEGNTDAYNRTQSEIRRLKSAGGQAGAGSG